MKALAGGLWLLACACVQAQNLQDLYESARQYDASYLSAQAQYEANLARANQALGGILPNVTLQSSQTRSQINAQAVNPALQGNLPGPNPRFYNVAQNALIVNQPLFRPVLWQTYRQSDAQTQLATAQYLSAEQDLIVRVSQAYFDWLNAQASLRAFDQQQKAVAEQLAAAKKNFEVGTNTITSVRDAQARFDLSLAQQIAARNDAHVKQLNLDMLTGLQHAHPQDIQDTRTLFVPPQESLPTWINLAQENNPAIKQAQFNLEIAQLETQKAQSAHLPTLDAQVSISDVRNEGGNNLYPFSTHVVNPSASMMLSVPIFSGFSTQNRVRETMALTQKAQSDLDAAQRTTELQTRAMYDNVISGLAQVHAYENALASSQSALDANRLGYSIGVNINIDVLNAQTQFYQTQRDLAKARYDTMMFRLKLSQSAGTLSTQELSVMSQSMAP